jgi:hypothetical protein
MTHVAFLESHHSGGTQSEVVSFGKWLKQYDSGSLESVHNFPRKKDIRVIRVKKNIMK